MPIQPIDLQTLFTQLDRVGRDQSALKEGAQLQASVQSAQIQKKTDEKAHTVNETRDTGEGGTEQIKERQGRSPAGGGGRGRGGSRGEEEDVPPDIIRDPDLGRNLDVSG
jgi:hypothetical protein